MSDVFLIREDGSSVLTERIRCKNEDQELQRIIEANLDLLPGDQIDPDAPRQWLLIRREMPVPDPSTGSERWSIDFFLADQDAIPTFVECKRYDDARARREVVGQMLEYVANGRHYWDSAQLMEMTEKTATSRGKTLDAELAAIGGIGEVIAADYFRQVEENLRAGRIRMIFALEDSSYELRSIVEFLQLQLKDAEVFIVEVRQYEVLGHRIVVPTLFGFTERARVTKKEVSTEASGGLRRAWNQESFLADAAAKISSPGVEAIKVLLDAAATRDWNIKWGTGKANGSISIRLPGAARRSLLSIFSNGTLMLNFGWLNENVHEESIRDQLADFAKECLKADLPKNWQQKYVPVSAERWAPEMSTLVIFLDGLKQE